MATQRETAIRVSPMNIGPLHRIRVIPHDAGLNRRQCNYTRACWIMFLGFPLDFQSMDYVKAAVSPFGRLLFWDNNSQNKSRVLVKALVLSPDRIP